ncbi:MAG: hypothetical protein AAGE84_11620 [Cyanobacteria bacterium P01_G01_bin.39]
MTTNTQTPSFVDTTDNIQSRISFALLWLRISIFLMMIVWAIDKFARPEHGAAVFSSFYGVEGIGTAIVYGIGILQCTLFFSFLIGFRKQITYGLVMLLHGTSTIIALPTYLNTYAGGPESCNILFWAAFPVLAACFGLYYLRDLDTRMTIWGSPKDVRI